MRGSVTLAGRLGLSTLFLGLVVVAVGTSAPELAVSVEAVFGGSPDIAVGNIVGSNIANLLLILGLGALISPIAAEKNVVLRDGIMLLLSTVILTWLGNMGGSIGASMGALMIALLLLYLTFAYFSERVHPSVSGDRAYELADRSRLNVPSIILDAVIIIAGLAAIKFGADFLIQGAKNVAVAFNVEQSVVGLTLVGLGTSLPELAVVLVAALKRQTAIAVGTIVGSNIFNVLAALGVTSIIHEIEIDSLIGKFDLLVLLLSTVILGFFILTRCRVSRVEGLLLVVGYFAYVYLRVVSIGGLLS